MDRDTIVRIARDVNSKKVSINDVTMLLTEFCITEHHRSLKEVQAFIHVVLHNQSLLSTCIETSLEYYKKKFFVCEVFKPITNLIGMPSKEVLLIY